MFILFLCRPPSAARWSAGLGIPVSLSRSCRRLMRASRKALLLCSLLLIAGMNEKLCATLNQLLTGNTIKNASHLIPYDNLLPHEKQNRNENICPTYERLYRALQSTPTASTAFTLFHLESACFSPLPLRDAKPNALKRRKRGDNFKCFIILIAFS